MTDISENNKIIELTTDIVSAYVSNNPLPVGDLPALIGSVHSSLTNIGNPQAVKPAEEKAAPAVPVKKSVQPDYIICLEDGKKFKSLKRHLRTRYDMTPEQYRDKWNLPADYPMVAPNYAKARSDLAKNMGLGQSRKKAETKKRSRKSEAQAAA